VVFKIKSSGKRLSELLEKHNLSVKFFAKEIGIKRETVLRWVTGSLEIHKAIEYEVLNSIEVTDDGIVIHKVRNN
jgi:transcriptional regulator with XRE-family HTH domain